jgi:hypothetical protein
MGLICSVFGAQRRCKDFGIKPHFQVIPGSHGLNPAPAFIA